MVTSPGPSTCQNNTAVIARPTASVADRLQRTIVFVGFHHAAHRNIIATMHNGDVSENSLRFPKASADPTTAKTENAMSSLEPLVSMPIEGSTNPVKMRRNKNTERLACDCRLRA